MNIIEIKNMVVHYGGVEALKGISLEVQQGTITTIIGANGAGKSTCLRAISGLVPLSSGEIWFEGNRIDMLPADKIVSKGIAHVPEGRRLFPFMSVQDNLKTGAYLRYGRKKSTEAIGNDIKFVEDLFPILKEKKQQTANRLSGGQQQMAALARGLMAKPKLLILDEPSLGLAPVVVKEMARIIKQIVGQGITVILVEQNASMALSLADQVYVFELGKIYHSGSPSEISCNDHIKSAYLGC